MKTGKINSTQQDRMLKTKKPNLISKLKLKEDDISAKLSSLDKALMDTIRIKMEKLSVL